MDLTTDIETVGQRKGRFTIGALSAGIDRISGPLQWSIYARSEFVDGRLGAYREDGAGIHDLRFDERCLASLTGALGFKLAYRRPVSLDLMSAQLRGEWLHEFTDGSRQGVEGSGRHPMASMRGAGAPDFICRMANFVTMARAR